MRLNTITTTARETTVRRNKARTNASRADENYSRWKWESIIAVALEVAFLFIAAPFIRWCEPYLANLIDPWIAMKMSGIFVAGSIILILITPLYLLMGYAVEKVSETLFKIICLPTVISVILMGYSLLCSMVMVANACGIT